jgi:uncharacterized protein
MKPIKLVDDPKYQEGRACYYRGEYFEAHEHWEELWLTLSGEEKTLVQGMIQVAAAWVKYHRKEPLGMRRLLDSALKKWKDLPNLLWSVNVEQLRISTTQCLEEALRWERGEEEDVPIKYLPLMP